jgi:hypothetical protein
MELPDYELLRTEAPTPERSRDARVIAAIAAVVLLVAAATAVYLVYGRRTTTAPTTATAAPSEPVRAPARPLGSDAEPIAVPPLSESDPLVRELVRRITSHPAALVWLATNGLIRNFALVVSNVVEGPTPAPHLKPLRPASPFQVVERNGELFVEAKSYERYDRLAAAAASIDPAGAARVYSTLKPRIEEAYAELGSGASFDQTLERAIVILLRTPVINGPVRVEPKGIGYRFADPRLEQLTGAQKQLLRAGPRNVRLMQSALRQLALALGIPAERLP